MTSGHRWLLGGGLAAASAGALVIAAGQGLFAADHLDPPARTDPAVDPTPDTPADLADIFAWVEGDKVYLSSTFAGPQLPGTPGFYDRNVLYTLNVSTAAPGTSAEIPIRWRFGPATNGSGSGISIENLPGVSGNVVGPVEQILTAPNGIRAYAGLRDDPFFFDSQGFRETMATGNLSFNRNRNFFGGKNVTVVIIEIPKSLLGSGPLDIWGTTARFGGQL